MGFVEYQPCEALRDHIDAYWLVQTDGNCLPHSQNILPDGCADLIVNIGSAIPMAGDGTGIRPGAVYLVGTMTAASRVSRLPNSCMAGIRFRPGGLSAFYELPMQETVNNLIDLGYGELLPEIDADERLPERLDRFFLKRLRKPHSQIVTITADIFKHGGQLSVDGLAGRHCIGIRSLERLVKKHTGIGPKALINIIRMQSALKKLKQPAAGESLLQVAYDTGYYDHAHLTNEIKKYTGLSPSAIMREYHEV
jgi:AraC-like DNA-binding protein